jgi:NADPH:quinone reductase-like Zn-dependent oxidoreductase
VIDHLKGIGANRISTKAQTFIEESSGMKAVQIKSYGDPLEVLEVVDVSEPGAPDANEALLGIEIATLNKHNSYSLATLWAAVRPSRLLWGNEGFGRVLAIGRGVVNEGASIPVGFNPIPCYLPGKESAYENHTAVQHYSASRHGRGRRE